MYHEKTEKGMPGYLNYKRKIEIIRTLAYFGIVIAILLPRIFSDRNKIKSSYSSSYCRMSSGIESACRSYYTLSLSFDRWRTSERNRVKN